MLLRIKFRRSSRSVCSNIAEAWRRNGATKGAFVLKLNDAEAEAAETQTWLVFAQECNYLSQKTAGDLHTTYDYIIGKLVKMIINPSPWLLKSRENQRTRRGLPP